MFFREAFASCMRLSRFALPVLSNASLVFLHMVVRRFLTFSGGCRRFFSGDFCFFGCGGTVFINPQAVYWCVLSADFCTDRLCSSAAFVLLHGLVFCQLHFSKNRSVFSLYLNVRRQVFKRITPKTMSAQGA